MTTERLPSQQGRFALFLFTYYAHVGTFASYSSLFFAARGMSAPQVGILFSLIQVMRIIGPNLWGWVADHTEQRVLVLRFTVFASIVAFCGIFFAETYTHFILVMVFLNLFTSAQGPLTEALMLAEMRGDLSNYGRVLMWGSVGFVLSVVGAGYLLDWLSVEALPWIAGALLLCIAGASLRISETPRAEATQEKPALLFVLRQRQVVLFFVSAALMSGCHMSLNAFYALYMEQAGYSKPVIGAMFACATLAEIVFFYFQASIFARFGARRIMMFAFAVALVRFPMIALAEQWLWVLILAQLLHAATFASHLSAAVITMQRWFAGPLQARGQALYMSLAYGVGGSLAGVLMSYCWGRFGPQSVFHAAAVLALAAAGAATLSFRWQRQAEHASGPPAASAP